MKLSVQLTTMSCLLLSLTGCFNVKNTDGLRLAYEKVDWAQSKAAELKTLKNVTDAQRQEAADLYRLAKSKVNGYLQDSITRAASYTVDEPAEKFTTTEAPESVNRFEKKVNQLRGRTTASAAVIAPIVAIAIEEIVKLNGEAQKAAYERFTQTVNKYMMKNYEEISTGSADQ
ncbi:hypothetical protein [Methylococcus sp. EFPC2]|uniref:hypothetical protein n=1 Tax=Methylococcus sp. EFPC2 TaxID=2812648 RepID=UPI001967EEE0|nr:hypothetical protein [Methylococcus sp. EFPC2]QSA96516.1 hypothetical protein JWZ97_15015 [Methylococcus sp. EFPC2]